MVKSRPRSLTGRLAAAYYAAKRSKASFNKWRVSAKRGTKSKTKHPKSKSKTKTKTKTKEKFSASDLHSALSSRLVTVPGSRLPRYVKTTGMLRYVQNHTAIYTSFSGQQGVATVCYVNSLAQCLTSTGVGYGKNENATGLFHMNPNEAVSGSFAAVVPTGTIVANDRIALLANSIMLEVSNMSGLATYLDIYLLECKKATQREPPDNWDIGMSDEGLNTGVQTFPTPGYAAPPTGGYQSYYMVGARPQESQSFNAFWRVRSVRKVMLGGGASETVTFVIRNQKVLKKNDLSQQLALGNNFVPGTFCIMFVQRGALVIDDTAATHQVTYGSTQIATIATCKSTVCAMKESGGRVAYSRSVSRATANVTLAKQEVMTTWDNMLSGTAGIISAVKPHLADMTTS